MEETSRTLFTWLHGLPVRRRTSRSRVLRSLVPRLPETQFSRIHYRGSQLHRSFAAKPAARDDNDPLHDELPGVLRKPVARAQPARAFRLHFRTGSRRDQKRSPRRALRITEETSKDIFYAVTRVSWFGAEAGGDGRGGGNARGRLGTWLTILFWKIQGSQNLSSMI
jgi:hypothetical protein